MSSRRQLVRSIAAGALAVSAGSRTLISKVAARQDGALVIVRSDDGLVVVDPASGTVLPWDGPIPASPTATPAATPIAVPPDTLVAIVTEGRLGYWMSSPGGGQVFRVDTGASSTWWWRSDIARAVRLDLPGDLEPAFPSGTVTRWFHGAVIDAAHLGSGTLRLLAVDIGTGAIVLDQERDRRLELAATMVSGDSALVAHVQGSNTGVAFWAADLRRGTRVFEVSVDEEPAMAAASSIELVVVADGDAVLVVAGIARGWPGDPESRVYVMHARQPERIRIVDLPGKLSGIIPDHGSRDLGFG